MAETSVPQAGANEPLVLRILRDEDGYIRRAAAAKLDRIAKRHERSLNALLNDACEYIVLAKAHAAAEETWKFHAHVAHADCDVFTCPTGRDLDRAADEALLAVQRVINRIES